MKQARISAVTSQVSLSFSDSDWGAEGAITALDSPMCFTFMHPDGTSRCFSKEQTSISHLLQSTIFQSAPSRILVKSLVDRAKSARAIAKETSLLGRSEKLLVGRREVEQSFPRPDISMAQLGFPHQQSFKDRPVPTPKFSEMVSNSSLRSLWNELEPRPIAGDTARIRNVEP